MTQILPQMYNEKQHRKSKKTKSPEASKLFKIKFQRFGLVAFHSLPFLLFWHFSAWLTWQCISKPNSPTKLSIKREIYGQISMSSILLMKQQKKICTEFQINFNNECLSLPLYVWAGLQTKDLHDGITSYVHAIRQKSSVKCDKTFLPQQINRP